MDSDILDDFEDDNNEDLLVMEKKQKLENDRNKDPVTINDFDESFEASFKEKSEKKPKKDFKKNSIKKQVTRTFGSDFEEEENVSEQHDREFEKLEKKISRQLQEDIENKSRLSEKVKEKKEEKKTEQKEKDKKCLVDENRKKELEQIKQKSKKIEGVKNLQDLLRENRDLFNNLKKVNKNLSDMIDRKGYENLLNDVKKEKNEFKNRPLKVKLQTHEKEIENNQKIINNLKIEYNNYINYLKKMDSTIILNSINQKITDKKNKIKILNKEIYDCKIKNKKFANFLVKENMDCDKKQNIKKIILDIDTYMGKNFDLKEKLMNLEEMKIELKKKIKKKIEDFSKLKENAENQGIGDIDTDILKRYNIKKKMRNKWKNFIEITEHNIDQKITFYEKDCEILKIKLKNLYNKNEDQNRILEIQHKQLQEYMKNGNIDNKQISLFDIEKEKIIRPISDIRKKSLTISQKKSAVYQNKVRINNLKNIYVSEKKNSRPPSKFSKKNDSKRYPKKMSSVKENLSAKKENNQVFKKIKKSESRNNITDVNDKDTKPNEYSENRNQDELDFDKSEQNNVFDKPLKKKLSEEEIFKPKLDNKIDNDQKILPKKNYQNFKINLQNKINTDSIVKTNIDQQNKKDDIYTSLNNHNLKNETLKLDVIEKTGNFIKNKIIDLNIKVEKSDFKDKKKSIEEDDDLKFLNDKIEKKTDPIINDKNKKEKTNQLPFLDDKDDDLSFLDDKKSVTKNNQEVDDDFDFLD